MKKMITCLWFDDQAEEAANFYVSVFKDASRGQITRYGKEGHEIHGRPEGSVMTASFTIGAQEFVALNGGPVFRFNEAISLQVICEDQAEVDYYWERLSAGGDPAAQQCGWLKDRYGLSWQVVPAALLDMLGDPDRAKTGSVMRALLQMKKLDIADLQQAYDSR
jgi:predicted 3-demethylubiquinone-9 3-methyltransferase (glyoxalase superfamily)